MTQAASRLERARLALAAGDVNSARRECARVLSANEDDEAQANAHLVLAACAQRLRDAALGLQHVRAAIGLQPVNPFAHYVHAELLESTGDKTSAIANVLHAVMLKPEFVQGWFFLGILEGERGDAAAAGKAFTETVRLDPNHARGWNNLGNALRSLARLPEAQQAFDRAVTLKPDYWLAVANLASTLRDTGQVAPAESLLRDALARSRVAPYRPLLVLLAGLLRERSELDEAARLYVQAIAAAPQESAGEWFNLGWLLAERGDPERARDAYARSYALDRRELRALFGQHLALPMIHADVDALSVARDRFAHGLARLDTVLPSALERLAPKEVLDGLRWNNFFLAYQGREDRALQSHYAALAARALGIGAPQWRAPIVPTPIEGRRIRIGFASAFLHEGTVGRYFQSWIVALSRERFEVFVYHLWTGVDAVVEAVQARADVFRAFAGSDARPSTVAPAILNDQLDVLVYPEVGMDVTTFALAALRLAPRQWCAWGHPITTGHATIDAFISCAAMEPPDAQSHYAERLLLLPGIGTRYPRPVVPEPVTRGTLGLPETGPLLLCPQSLFKIHPDNDRLFVDILVANPAATLLLFEGRHPAITDQFMRRLERIFAASGLAVRARVRVLPTLPHPDYLRVNLACDAMLDTLHWSGGNTSLDALACGLSVVTLPGAYMRGRQSAAMLRLLGVEELIARDRADYVRIATRLADETSWRCGLAERIRDAQARLFERRDALDALERLLIDEVGTEYPK